MLDTHLMEQGSPEWHEARMGIPTASQFSTVMAKGQGKSRRTYMLKLAGEIVTGEPMQSFSNAHMERGHEMEPDARAAYEFLAEADVVEVGFVREGRAGCSPDGLISDKGGVEIKSKLPHLLIDALLTDKLPPEHKAQVQGSMWVTGREWWDFVAYWPGLPLFVKRVERDPDYIAELAEAVEKFNTELDEVVAQVRAYGEAKKEAA